MKSLRHFFAKLPADGDLRHRLRGFNSGPEKTGSALSIKDLVEDLGVDVYVTELPKGVNGCLVQDAFAPSGYAIGVNQRLSVEAKRFTLAHELAHFLFHTDKSDPLVAPSFWDFGETEFYLGTADETEANEFAETLFFGDGALEAALLSDRDLEIVRRKFGVSDSVLRIAIRKLGPEFQGFLKGRGDGDP